MSELFVCTERSCLTLACCWNLQVGAVLSAEPLCQSLQTSSQQQTWRWTYLLRIATTVTPGPEHLRKLLLSCLAFMTQDGAGAMPSGPDILSSV